MPTMRPDPSRRRQPLPVPPHPQAAPPPSALAPAASGAGSPCPVPAYRRWVFADRADDWAAWIVAVDRLPAIEGCERRAYLEIFAAEGGCRVDPRGPAASGLVPATLDELIARRRLRHVAPGTPPARLSLDQRAAAYRGYFDEVLAAVSGHAALARIGDPAAAAAFADTLFRHGRRGGSRLIQQAIAGVDGGGLSIDGRQGPATLAAYCRLAAAPATRRRLVDALADARLAATHGGERARFDHFRFAAEA